MSKKEEEKRHPTTPVSNWEKLEGSLPFQGRVDDEALLHAFAQYMVYEDWVAAGRPDTIDHVPDLPSWYLGAAYANTTAFEYMRHSAAAYFRSAHTRGESFGGSFLSIVRRIREAHPDSYRELGDTIREAGAEFERQHRNAGRAHQRTLRASDGERLEVALQWYVTFFETNLYLWFLCVLGRFMRTGKVEPRAFGGPLTESPQGALVNQALDELAGTPFLETAELVYDTEIRNAISHNNYELTTDRRKALVLHPDGRTLSWDEAWNVLAYAQDFHQGLLSALATVMTAPRPEDWQYLREYGVTTFDWLVPEDGPVSVILNQLWCFAELDPEGSWLDSSELTICDVTEGLHRGVGIRFGTAGFIEVPDDKWLEVFRQSVERDPWLLVTRYPVAPYLGVGYPRYREGFEIVGTPDEHVVPYGGKGTINPGELPPRPTQLMENERREDPRSG